MFNEDSVFKS